MKRIEINGKQFPCRMTMGAMLRFKRETGHDVSQMDMNDLSDLVVFIWCCVASASKADGVDFDMELMDFADRLDPATLSGFYASMKEDEKKTGDAEAKTRKQKTS